MRYSSLLRSAALGGLLVLAAGHPAAAQPTTPAPVTQVPGLPFWQWQTAWPTGYALNDVHAFTDSTALVAGNHGTLLYTPDAGRTWQPRTVGTDNDLLQLSFAPGSQTGWVIYNTPRTNAVREAFTGPGEVRKTTDGGLTWTRQRTNSGEPYSAQLFAIQAVSPTECYLLYAYSTYSAGGPFPGPNGDPDYYVKHTTNGGATWTRLPVPITFGRRPTRLAFATAAIGLVAGSENPAVCWRTTDHGQTWQSVLPPNVKRLNDVRFTDATQGWMSADTTSRNGPGAQAIYRTADAGATWTMTPAVPAALGVIVHTLQPLNAQTCLAVGSDTQGPVFRTTDGGTTWRTALTFSFDLKPMARLSATGRAWVMSGSRIWTSADTGTTWRSCSRHLTADSLRSSLAPLVRVHFPAPTHGRAISFLPELLRLDGGPTATWRKQPLQGLNVGINWGTATVLAADFPDQDTTHLLVQDIGPLDFRYWHLRLTGAGAVPQTTATLLPVSSAQAGILFPQLRFRDGRRGVLTIGEGRLFVTEDGGQSWQQPTLPGPVPLYAANWANDSTVFVAGDSTRIFRSTDGGQRWIRTGGDSTSGTADGIRYLTGPLRATFLDLFFTSPTTGYWGLETVLQTRDGGSRWRQQLFLPTLYTAPLGSFWRGPDIRGVRAGYNPRHLWAFGSDQLRSADAGATWAILAPTRLNINLPSINPDAAAAIDLFNACVSQQGNLLRYSEKYLQTDTAATQPRAFCTGDTLTVAFTKQGIFSPAEDRFRIELSNKMGRFRPNETTILPLVGAAAASPLKATLPATLAAGTRYRVRVIRADSSVLGGDNERDLTIWTRPAAVAVAPTDSARFCAGDSVQLVAPVGSGQYQWSTGDTTRTLWVRTAGSYAVAVAGGGGCFGPISRPVTVRSTPVPVAPVLTPTQAGGLILLTATPALVGATYTWTSPNGVIVAGATGPTLLLTAAAQNGFYTVMLTQRGCASPPSVAVSVTITGLTAEAAAAQLTLTPNPAAGAVRVANAGGLRTVDVRDLAGRLVLAVVEAGSEPEITLPLAGVPVGTYLVQATLPDGRVLTRRLVVNR